MIRWKGSLNGRPIVGLGITRENIDRLAGGEPIYVKGKSINIDFDIMISFFETTEDAMNHIGSKVDAETVIHREPPKKGKA